MDHNKLWKILQEMEIPDHLICLLRNPYAGQEATVRTSHGTTGSKLGKYNKAVNCHPAYLTYMQSQKEGSLNPARDCSHIAECIHGYSTRMFFLNKLSHKCTNSKKILCDQMGRGRTAKA